MITGHLASAASTLKIESYVIACIIKRYGKSHVNARTGQHISSNTPHCSMMTQKKIQSEKKVQLLLFFVHNYTCMHAMILDKLHDIKVKITNEELYFEQQVW